MKVTFFGTTTLLFDDGKDQVLFDAHFTRPPFYKWIHGLMQTNTELVDRMIRLHRIDRLRAVFVSHTHFDHVMDAPYVASRTGPRSTAAHPPSMSGGAAMCRKNGWCVLRAGSRTSQVISGSR